MTTCSIYVNIHMYVYIYKYTYIHGQKSPKKTLKYNKKPEPNSFAVELLESYYINYITQSAKIVFFQYYN